MRTLVAVCTVACLLGLPGTAWPGQGEAAGRAAADIGAARLLPPTTVLYAEMTNPDELVDLILDHPLRDRVESLEPVQEALRQQNSLQFRAAVALIEIQLGKPWREALTTLTGEGIAVAVDAESEQVALMIRSSDEDFLNHTVATLIQLSRDDATSKGMPDPYQEAEYRGHTAYRVGDARFAVAGPWLLVANGDELGQAMLDRFLDGGSNLSEHPGFLAARDEAAEDAAAWAFVDLKTLRESGAADDLFRGQTENPAAELLLGGITEVLQHADHAVAQLQAEPDRLRLEFGLPFQSEWISEARTYYFGPDATGRAPRLPEIDRSLFTLSTYRDVSEMWLRAGDLFDENVNDGIAQAESNLSTLFSGKDFGEEILGEFQPEMQLIVVRQDFEEIQPTPAIKLPAFAAVFRMKDPERMTPEFRRTFQSLIGFLNVVGAMNGQPQLDMEMERQGDDRQLVVASYVPDVADEGSTSARINYNFSPSIAFSGDTMIVSSAGPLARMLMTSPVATEPGDANTDARLDVSALREVLEDNREHLIAQNMLEEGNSREEAEAQIGALLDILQSFQEAAMTLQVEPDMVELSFEVHLDTQAP